MRSGDDAVVADTARIRRRKDRDVKPLVAPRRDVEIAGWIKGRTPHHVPGKPATADRCHRRGVALRVGRKRLRVYCAALQVIVGYANATIASHGDSYGICQRGSGTRDDTYGRNVAV